MSAAATVDPEIIIAVRNRLASAEASLRSLDVNIEAGGRKLAKDITARDETRKRIAVLTAWLADNPEAAS